jgi:hypothetical protein
VYQIYIQGGAHGGAHYIICVCPSVCPAFMNEIIGEGGGGRAYMVGTSYRRLWTNLHHQPTYLGGQILLLTHFHSIAQQFRGQTTTHSIWRKSEYKLYYISLILYSSKVLVVVVVFVSLSLFVSEVFLKYTFMRYFHQIIYYSMVICTTVSFFVEI